MTLLYIGNNHLENLIFKKDKIHNTTAIKNFKVGINMTKDYEIFKKKIF